MVKNSVDFSSEGTLGAEASKSTDIGSGKIGMGPTVEMKDKLEESRGQGSCVKDVPCQIPIGSTREIERKPENRS